MHFVIRVANDGSVYAVFQSEYAVARAAFLFPEEEPCCFDGYFNAVRLSQWRKDSFRDAALHG